MKIDPPDSAILGYCTNVHAGADLCQTMDNLQRYAPRVKQLAFPASPMGLGLWFSARSARQMLQPQELERFKQWLAEHDLIAYTLNGFPYGDFHELVVKHRVYEPDWSQPERLEYTLDLSRILAELLAEGAEGSISTLPLGWPDAPLPGFSIEEAAVNLLAVAEHLYRLRQETGKLIHLNLEPEPGCALDTSDDVVAFYQDFLFRHKEVEKVHEHIRVCHDICHAAVMFEDQCEVLKKYRQAGIRIGKVQISSALKVSFNQADPTERRNMLSQLRAFEEDRYLHQTTVQNDGKLTCFADLPETAAVWDIPPVKSQWRVHFHVPIFADQLGRLHTTQEDIRTLLTHIEKYSDCRHFEVETYAWNVLPEQWQFDDLAVGIAEELKWITQPTPQPTN